MPESLPTLTDALKDRYIIERELGSGGMATVYLADDVKHNRKVALKVMRPELTAALGVERFLREIRIIARLQHPHILPLYDSGEAGGFLYYVMPYMAGPSLRDRIKSGPLPFSDVVRIMRDVVDALVMAHSQGVVHRDIKPDNVLLSGRSAVVADFGVAKALSEATGHQGEGTTAGMALGTPAYMAPEQAAADPDIDHRADIYSVGVLAYEMLTSRPPFTGMPPQQILAAQVTTPPEPVSAHRPGCPGPLQDIVMKCLAKIPAGRYQNPEELLADIEALSTPSGGMSATSQATPRVRRRRLGTWIVVGSVLAGITLAAIIAGDRTGNRLDRDLIAVAPFDVLDPGLDLWREGLVDLLSANLDGAGPLRTVPPSLVVAGWSGRADATSAAELATRLGAGLAIYGRLLISGTDSVRLTATMIDVATGSSVGQAEIREDVTRIDRLADSLTIQLLGELTQRRQLGAIEFTSFGSSSPTALKAFLEAERFYRISQWDSARFHYARAMQQDPTFALAYSRMGKVVGWRRGREGSARLALEAGELNRGLAPRESLLVTADSIDAAMEHFQGTATDWANARRLFPTLDRAIRLYPQDPGAWYQLGEARVRWGPFAGATDRETLGPFNLAVELDSAFTPVYLLLIPLSFEIDGLEAGRAAITAYRSHDPPHDLEAGMVLVEQLLGRVGRDTTALRVTLDTVPTMVLSLAGRTLMRVPDSLAAALAVSRERFAREGGRTKWSLVWHLAYRGRLREAHALSDSSDVAMFTELALLDAIPRDTVAQVAGAWLSAHHGSGVYHTLPWWSARRDTSSINQAIAEWQAQLASGNLMEEDGPITEYAVEAANAYLALARTDSADALARFRALPTWPWGDMYRELLTLGELLAAQGRHADALDVLDQVPVPRTNRPRPGEIYWILQRGKSHEALGDTEEAIRAYDFVIGTWYGADPSLQPMVDLARRRRQALQ